MENYENPLPILELDTDLLEIETKDSFQGKFKIKNIGGGLLKGHVLSRCAGLTLEPTEWEGNNREINYTWNATAAGTAIGQLLQAVCYVTSNGGEKELPVNAKLTKMSISTAEGLTIANIMDFFEYAAKHPVQARRLFTDSEFYMLLLATGYTYMEVYESLHKDANRERAMDNFFILSGLKKQTTLEVLPGKEKTLEFLQKPREKDMLYSNFIVQKSDNGYVEAPIIAKNEVPWLTLSSGKLSASDFNDKFTAVVNFSIDPTQIKKSYARETVIIGTDPLPNGSNVIEIIYRRTPELTIRLNRETYRYADKGVLEIINNTGEVINVKPFCAENYIRFSGKAFEIGAVGEIPFDVKLSAFMSAQMLFRKQPYMKTVIELEISGQTTSADLTKKLLTKKPLTKKPLTKKLLPITVGEW